MLYILWGLLNLFLFAGFVVISFYAVKQIRTKYGLFVAVIFTCMLFSFANQPEDTDHSSKDMHHLYFRNNRSSFHFPNNDQNWHIDDSLAKYYDLADSKNFTVYKTPLFDIKLHVTYARDSASGVIAPVYAASAVEGTFCGIDWQPDSPMVQIDEKGEYIRFIVTGRMTWKLMNMIIFTSGKTFEGSVKLSE